MSAEADSICGAPYRAQVPSESIVVTTTVNVAGILALEPSIWQFLGFARVATTPSGCWSVAEGQNVRWCMW